MELAKLYDAREAQSRFLKFWQERRLGHADPADPRPAFSVVIPPPNVTGALHLGHALNNTLQDVLVRWKRASGFNAEWIPGTDHAGIATQAVVERRVMAEEKKTRHDLGREELVRRIWGWKDQYEAKILGQLRSIGASADWERTRFTLDPICAKAVRETFFRMFRDGYIYRGQRLVNWDAQLQTSVADDETYVETTKGGFYTFRYPIEGDPEATIQFSTTRPETMLGDTALCVHPDDVRYKMAIGRYAVIPLNGRRIPIIADALLADPTLGTGCVKVTPAHDPNDYACYQRHPEIGMMNILNPDGTINANGGEFAGMDRYKAREAVTKFMEDNGYFDGKEDRDIPLAYSDRSKTPIEPYLSDQWFIKMGDRTDGKPGLAQTAMDAVTSGRVRFFPERYARTYLDWLGEKRDWCISRQLWWGHQIPVWHKTRVTREGYERNELQEKFKKWRDDGRICYTDRKLSENPPEDIFDSALPQDFCCVLDENDQEVIAGLEQDGLFKRDPDVLDTWFSSALWPHSVFGWPEQTPELQRFYPTSVLSTSRDIITLWVARMVIVGEYNLGEVPFRDVYIHPKVLDGFGEGMSKSKGNGVDPLDIIDLYGADALRFGMASVATETQDSRLPVTNVCPHCGESVPVKQEHMYMRTKKLACPKCKTSFRPGGPWPESDPELPTAKQGSDRFEQGRNFANKLWNAARFILMNLDGYSPAAIDPKNLPIEDRWILSRLRTATQDMTAALEGYKFAESVKTLYDFSWSDFCDWYIEMAKNRLKGDEATRAGVQRVLVGVLDRIVRLAQPVMPFLAESLWQALAEAAPERGITSIEKAGPSVCEAAWPNDPDTLTDPAVETRFARMQELVRGLREVRNRYSIEAKTPLTVSVRASAEVVSDLESLRAFIGSLAGVGEFTAGPNVAKPPQSAAMVTADFEAYTSLAGLIDPAAEVKRLEKQIAERTKQLEGSRKKLDNKDFVARASAEVVQTTRDQVEEIEKQVKLLVASLDEMRAAS